MSDSIIEKEENNVEKSESVLKQQRYVLVGTRLFEVYEEKQDEKIRICL